MATNPLIPEIQKAYPNGSQSPPVAPLSPAAAGAARMAGYPPPVAPEPVSAPPGMLLPKAGGPTPLIGMPDDKGQAILSNGQEPSPETMHAVERNRLLAQKPGDEQLYGKIAHSQFGEAHPWAGRLLGGLAQGLATAGDIGLTVGGGGMGRLAAEMIPGTALHHELLLHQADRAVGEDTSNDQRQAATQADQAEIPLRQAEEDEAQARADALMNPQPKEIAPRPIVYRGSNGEPLAGTEHGGKYFDAAGNPLGADTQMWERPAAGSNAFAQWAANPQKYEDFQKTMAEIKAQVAAEHPHQAANSSFMNIYAAQRFLQMAYSHNPALLPVASQMIGKLLNLTPEQKAAMGTVPEGQPLSPETGNPIGTSMPESPTSGTRTQAQTAARVLTELPRVRTEIDAMGKDLGPIAGRWNDFVTGKLGSGDPRYETLRADIQFLNSAAAKFHLNSVRAVEEFNHLASAGKMTPAVLSGYLNAVESWAKTAQGQERGYGETQTWEPPPGAPPAPRQDGKYLYDGNRPVAKSQGGKWVSPNA